MDVATKFETVDWPTLRIRVVMSAIAARDSFRIPARYPDLYIRSVVFNEGAGWRIYAVERYR